MKAYSKSELAMLYMPNATIEAARNCLASWIRHNESLKSELKDAGYTSHAKLLTPKQVRIIFHHLGQP